MTSLSLPSTNEIKRTSRISQMRDSSPATKHGLIANEIVTSEETYVSRLYIIDKVFSVKIEEANEEKDFFPYSVVETVFSNISTIHQFHQDFLLPQLQKRLLNWESTPRIGDLLKQFAPFLKLYTDYINNFDKATNTLNHWISESAEFAAFLAELQTAPECAGLSLQHLLIEPIQRIPRYQLLLQDYLKNLPEKDPDEADAQEALSLVTTAATHLNESMRKIEKFQKLVELNEQFGGGLDLSTPGRELLREGHVTQICAMALEQPERYLFLFNDTLVVATEQLIGGKAYHSVAQLDLDGMQIAESDNIDMPNTFYVKAKRKTMEFKTRTPEEKCDWMVAISDAILEFCNRKSTRTKKELSSSNMSKDELGTRAPTLIRDLDVSMCLQCSAEFGIFRWRHHCRACGIVVCDACSSKRLFLRYANKYCRVCDKCYDLLTSHKAQRRQRPTSANVQRRSALLVKGGDIYFVNDYLHVSGDRGRTWCRRWVTVHADFVLFIFKAHQDIAAENSVPLPGHQVEVVTSRQANSRPYVFRLFHHNIHSYWFQAEDQGQMEKWVKIIQKATRAENPGVYV